MTIASSNLVAADDGHVLADLAENLATPAPAKLLQTEHCAMKEDVAPGSGRHSAAAEVLQLRAELHRERLAAAAAKTDSLRLIDNMRAQRDEARERALGLQAALDSHLRAEFERLSAVDPLPQPAAAPAPSPTQAPARTPHASEDEAALLAAVVQPLGFHHGRPVAAMLIFRCCVRWNTLEQDRTALVERILATVGAAIEAGPADTGDACGHLCYWLATTASLLQQLHMHAELGAGSPPPAGNSGLLSSARNTLSMLARTRSGAADASMHGGSSFVSWYASRRPAHALRQALSDCMDSLLTDLRDDAKRALQTPLPVCIYAAGDRTAARWVPDNAAAGASKVWAALLDILQGLHEQLAANEVPLFLRRKLLLQLFSFINVQLFNHLLLRRECCSFTNGEYVKHGLAQVEEWLLGMGSEVAGESWDELKYIRQAVNFLVLHAKQKKTLDDIQQNLCSALSVQQLYRISTMYWDDKFGTETVSPEVLQQMRGVMQRQQGSASHSFLLDDDSSNPFQAAEVLSMNDKELYSEMPVPEPLQGNKAFDFLQRDLKLSAAAL